MMLQIDHRESHDVDIFLPDAQYLSYLDPKLQDFEFEIGPSDYTGDGTGFLKLAFKDIAEIDFIIGHAMTGDPTINRTIEGEQVDLETRSPGQARRSAAIFPIFGPRFIPSSRAALIGGPALTCVNRGRGAGC